MTPKKVMHPGVEFDFGGGVVLLVPSLSLGSIELLQERLNALPTLAVNDPQAVATVVDAAHAALVRNYPDATRAEVAELVDLANLGDVYECLMDVGGLRRRAQQAERAQRQAAEGNALAPAVTVPAGAPSTPA